MIHWLAGLKIFGTWNLEHGTWNMSFFGWLAFGTWVLEHGTCVLEHGTWVLFWTLSEVLDTLILSFMKCFYSCLHSFGFLLLIFKPGLTKIIFEVIITSLGNNVIR